MNRQIERIYSKQCRYCSSKEKPVQIFWDDFHKHFADGPNTDSPRHSCPSSSTKDRQLDQDKKLNVMLNDLKQEISSKLSDERERIDSLQRSTARNTSILTEIKAKLDSVLRNG